MGSDSVLGAVSTGVLGLISVKEVSQTAGFSSVSEAVSSSIDVSSTEFNNLIKIILFLNSFVYLGFDVLKKTQVSVRSNLMVSVCRSLWTLATSVEPQECCWLYR